MNSKCYFCNIEVNPGAGMAVSGLGPMKYVCEVCIKLTVTAVVMQAHDEKNAASRRHLAKRGSEGVPE
jgi:hypothetical protein